jgi:hypothetical protein
MFDGDDVNCMLLEDEARAAIVVRGSVHVGRAIEDMEELARLAAGIVLGFSMMEVAIGGTGSSSCWLSRKLSRSDCS